MSNSLVGLRALWERGACLVHNEGKFGAVSVCKYKGAYSVNRYFKTGEVWVCSQDLSIGTADDAFLAYAKAVSLTH